MKRLIIETLYHVGIILAALDVFLTYLLIVDGQWRRACTVFHAAFGAFFIGAALSGRLQWKGKK